MEMNVINDEFHNKYYQERPLTAPGCITGNPVGIEIQQCDPFKMASFQETPKKKEQGFWKSLFNKKKCNNCLKKKTDCACKPKKNKVEKNFNPGRQNGFDNKDFPNCIETSRTGNCPRNCNLPPNPRGVGCHLYFCIDKKQKNYGSKKKTWKNKQNMKMETHYEQNHLIHNKCLDKCYQRDPVITVVCDETVKDPNKITNNTVKNIASSSIISGHDYSGTRINNITRKKSVGLKINSSSRLSKLQEPKNAYYAEAKNDDMPFNYNDKNIASFDQTSYQNETKQDFLLRNGQNVFHNVYAMNNSLPTETNDAKQKQAGGFKPTPSVSEKVLNSGKENGASARKDKLEIPIKLDEKNFEKVAMTVKIKDTPQSSGESMAPEGEELDNASLLTEYSTFRKKSKRKSTANGMFAKNSLITLRRERRQTLLEGRVSLILQKLTNIEDKVAEIEKKSGTNKSNITMGIMCDGKKSKVSIKLEKEAQKKKEQEVFRMESNNEKEIRQATFPLIPCKQSSNKIIKIRSQNDKIFIKTPADVSVVRLKDRVNYDKIRSQQLMYENAMMDVHTVGSNAKSMTCKNPKIVISYPQSDKICQNPDCPNKWRRISEELKISEQDLNSPKVCICKSKK